MSSEEPHWRTRPGGLSAINFRFPEGPTTEQLIGYIDVDFFITVLLDPGISLDRYDIPSAFRARDSALGYYWANQFGFHNGSRNGVDGYMGIQTLGHVTTLDNSASSRIRHVKNTRLAIFSMWGALGAAPGPINSYCSPFDNEGTGWKCTLEYAWQQGTKYCLRIRKINGIPNTDQSQWWRGTIIDTSTNHETVIGDIKVPQHWSGLHNNSSCFTEYFSQIVNQSVGDEDDNRPNPRVCQFMPRAEVLFCPPLADGGKVPASSLSPNNYGKCAYVSSFARLTSKAIVSSGEVVMPPESLLNCTGRLYISNRS